MRRNFAKLGVLALCLSSVASPSFALAADGERVGEEVNKNTNTLFSLSSTGLSTQDLTNGITPEQLVQNLLGGGVTVQNVKFNGAPHAAGTFTGGDGIIGFNDGIILSSGRISDVVGPNLSDGVSASNGSGSDPDLASLIPGYSINDATVLEFDFIPENDVISFEYVFASDEYNEYVNSSYNDVFGFFVNGQNKALIPGTTTPVSINNVNLGKNSSYYVNNDLSDVASLLNTEMDGLTKVLYVEAPVKKGEVNHIKMAIADAGDSAFDSNVFIKAKSFIDKPVNTAPIIDSPVKEPLTVNEGEEAKANGAWSDENASDSVSLSASLGKVNQSGTNDNGTWDWSFATVDDLDDNVTITANDGVAEAKTTFGLKVKNVEPSIQKVNVPVKPLVNTEIKVSADFTDPGKLDTHKAVWDWGDGTTTTEGVVTETNGSGSATGNHVYSAPGIYTVTVTVTDKDGGSVTATGTVEVVEEDIIAVATAAAQKSKATQTSIQSARDKISANADKSLINEDIKKALATNKEANAKITRLIELFASYKNSKIPPSQLDLIRKQAQIALDQNVIADKKLTEALNTDSLATAKTLMDDALKANGYSLNYLEYIKANLIAYK